FCLEAMDSHGGWVASASDLVRFGMDFDNPEKSKLLKASSIKRMFARPAPGTEDGYYAFGWNVKPIKGTGKGKTSHGGFLEGNSALLVRRADGLTLAVLFNSDMLAKVQRPADKIEGLLHAAADAVKKWP